MTTPTELRKALTGLSTLASRDLAALWRKLEGMAQGEEALRDVLPSIIETYGAAAATVAADWYDDIRDKVGAKGRFTAIPAEMADPGTQALIGWAVEEAQSYEALQSLVEGGMQRRVANYSRLTVTRSAIADPAARGWQRTGVGGCAFCQMLIGRGAVYSEATVDFASHDRCNCGAAPAFGGEPLPVKPYTPSKRKGTAADRARARAYIRGEAPSTKTTGVESVADVDAARSVAQMRQTLEALERSNEKFSSPGTRRRIEELRSKIAAR